MSNLIPFNIKKFKSKYDIKEQQSILEDSKDNHKYKRFQEKFNLDSTLYNAKNNSLKELCIIIKKMFMLDNKTGIIDVINGIYNDGWDKNNTNVEFKKNSSELTYKEDDFDLILVLSNEYTTVEYDFVFNVEDYENLAIIIFRKVLYKENSNIVSFFKNNNHNSQERNHNPLIIMINANMVVPDILALKTKNDSENYMCKFDILKGWKYDLKQMYDMGMYLLFPLKILDLTKRIMNMNYDMINKEMIKSEIINFFRNMNVYLRKLNNEGLVSQDNIYEMNIICFQLLANINNNVELLDIKETVFKDIIVKAI